MSSESNAALDPLILPIATIQHDFLSVIADVDAGLVDAEDVWVSCYKYSSAERPSVHGKVRIALGETSRQLELQPREGVGLTPSRIRWEKEGYTVECAALGIPPTPLRTPRHTVVDEAATSSHRPKQLSALAVAPDLSQIALGYEDGTIRRLPLRLLSSSSPESSKPNGDGDKGKSGPLPQVTTATYAPHLSNTSVTALRYFPSSRVLLSAGTDFALHILDASPSLPSSSSAILKSVRSLKGHVRSVTDAAIVERGRNVLSCARDGTVRLWDVGAGEQIRVMGAQNYAAVNAMAFGASPSHAHATASPTATPGEVEPSADTREVGTAHKLAFLALQSGAVEVLDPSSSSSSSSANSNSIWCSQLNTGPLVSVAYDAPSSLLAAGSASGVITLFDVRFLSSRSSSPSLDSTIQSKSTTPLCAFQRNAASVSGLAFTRASRQGTQIQETSLGARAAPELAIATPDGLPFLARVLPNGPEVAAELVGAGDCEPCRVLAIAEDGVWIGGEEGMVRCF